MVQLGGFEVVSEVGRGGMGVVYRGRGPDGRDVAIKLLVKLDAGTALARFEREKRLLAELAEAGGFVPLLGAGASPRGPFIVMPFLAGGTLEDRLARGPLAVDEAVELAIALAQALGRAHERGIVHRDLKPSNVLFARKADHGGAAAEPLIADLGLAKHVGAAHELGLSGSLSKTGGIVGTAGYLAPEQASDSKHVGPAADVFSLGAILYECLAGTPAFAGATVLEVLSTLVAGRYEPLRNVRPDTPAWLAQIVDRALAPDPAARFPDGTAFARALEHGADAVPRRSRVAVAAAVALVIAVAGGALVYARLGSRSTGDGGPPTPAPPPAKRPPPPVAPQPPPPPPRSSTPSEPVTAQEFLSRGDERERSGDMDGALDDYARAAELAPDSGTPFAKQGAIKLSRLDHRGALPLLEKAVALTPEMPQGWVNLGLTRQQLGDAAGARAAFDRGLAIDADIPVALGARAALRAGENDLAGARIDLDRALELEKKAAWIWSLRATVRGNTGDLAGGIADTEKALELDPTDVTTIKNLAVMRWQSGDRARAKADMKRAVERARNDAEAAEMRATLDEMERTP